MTQSATQEVRAWLDNVVVALNFCPFAAAPLRAGRVRIVASEAREPVALLGDLLVELRRLDATVPAVLETTLLVVENMLADFDEYNQFLDLADALLRDTEREGLYQIASFHPRYQFAGTRPSDLDNLTNCAPWPVLHLLREASVSRALAGGADASAISARNIAAVRSLGMPERQRLFSWWAAGQD